MTRYVLTAVCFAHVTNGNSFYQLNAAYAVCGPTLSHNVLTSYCSVPYNLNVRPLSGSWMFYPKLMNKCSSVVWTVIHNNPLSTNLLTIFFWDHGTLTLANSVFTFSFEPDKEQALEVARKILALSLLNYTVV